MKRAKRVLTRINLSTIFFIAVSFMSGTFAWFAFSGLSNIATEIDIKAWNIEINKNDKDASNKIVITLPQISPGMEAVKDTITITNKGDADALVNYTIKKARILGAEEDNFIQNNETTSEYIEDIISHNYPFHINVALSKDYVLSNGGQSVLEVSVSWPLDSGTDELDGLWGSKTYNFLKEEQDKFNLDNNYSMMLPIEIEIELSAEQSVGSRNTLHVEYAQGEEIYINPVTNEFCELETTGCMKTFVIDSKNLIGDDYVNVIPDFGDISYETNFQDIAAANAANWKVQSRSLKLQDIFKIISRDVITTVVKTENLSDRLLGSTKNLTRLEQNILKIKQEKSTIQFDDTRFSFLKTSSCVWIDDEYDIDTGFIIKNGQIIAENKNTICKSIPVISIKK